MSQCRRQHTKCGAEKPVCVRCRAENKPCFYTTSRRGRADGFSVAAEQRSSLLKGNSVDLTYHAFAPLLSPISPVRTDCSTQFHTTLLPGAAPASLTIVSTKTIVKSRFLDQYYKYGPLVPYGKYDRVLDIHQPNTKNLNAIGFPQGPSVCPASRIFSRPRGI